VSNVCLENLIKNEYMHYESDDEELTDYESDDSSSSDDS